MSHDPTHPEHFEGILCVGDPHAASRAPGFRQDDYGRAIVEKLAWCVALAKSERLLLVLLGDLFHWPRDNANWLLSDLLKTLQPVAPVLAVAGNHDCAEDTLSDDDSLSVLVSAGMIKLLERAPWTGFVNEQPVYIGGSAWSERLPSGLLPRAQVHEKPAAFVLWITHHDIGFAGRDGARLTPCALPGIDMVINGHIHTPLPDARRGNTLWLNPGNIARLKRSQRDAIPCALRLTLGPDAAPYTARLPIPCAPFTKIFAALPDDIAALNSPTDSPAASAFVRGLAELLQLRTGGGAGLAQYLSQHLHTFEPPVADELRSLAQEVLPDEHPWKQRPK